MRLYKYLHSCILLEDRGEKILIDPGLYSFLEGKISPDQFKNISAVLITHEHKDHVDIGSLKIILKNNPAKILTNSGVGKMLNQEGIQAEILDEGDTNIGNFKIKVLPAEHEKILAPIPYNTGYLINNSFLHPGDSLDSRLCKQKGVKVLALPIMAPWLRAVDTVEFAKSMSPEIVIPIHDGFAKDFFRESQYRGFEKYLSNFKINFTPLNTPEDFIEIS